MHPSDADEGSLPLFKDSVGGFEKIDVILNVSMPIFDSLFRAADFFVISISSFRRSLRF